MIQKNPTKNGGVKTRQERVHDGKDPLTKKLFTAETGKGKNAAGVSRGCLLKGCHVDG